MRPFLIDTDTASDDAVALLLALRHPDVDVRAITVVAGNVPVDQGVQNALYTVELAGADVPVFRGARRTRVPGRAWLQFEVSPVAAERGSTITQTAIFDPSGLFGLVYWYGLWPFHGYIFGGMLRNIVTAATASGR